MLTPPSSRMLIFGSLLAGLAAAAGLLYARRLRTLRNERVVLTDDMVRRIEDEGWLPGEEAPLDWEEIEDEERRFWEESWDEPEELG